MYRRQQKTQSQDFKKWYKYRHIQFRVNTEEYDMLQNVLDKFGIGRIREDDVISDKMRSLIVLLNISKPGEKPQKEKPKENPVITVDIEKPKEEVAQKEVSTTQAEQKPDLSMFKGYIYCPKKKKMVDSSKCIEKCPNALDREACKEMRCAHEI